MKKHIYEIDKKGYISEVYLGEFDENGNLISHTGEFITVGLPQPLLFYRPKWIGTKWIEGATQEEIDELTKVEPQPPTHAEILEQRLADLELMLAEILFN